MTISSVNVRAIAWGFASAFATDGFTWFGRAGGRRDHETAWEVWGNVARNMLSAPSVKQQPADCSLNHLQATMKRPELNLLGGDQPTTLGLSPRKCAMDLPPRLRKVDHFLATRWDQSSYSEHSNRPRGSIPLTQGRWLCDALGPQLRPGSNISLYFLEKSFSFTAECYTAPW